MRKSSVLLALFLAVAPVAVTEVVAFPRAGLVQKAGPLARLKAARAKIKARIQARRAARAAAKAAAAAQAAPAQ